MQIQPTGSQKKSLFLVENIERQSHSESGWSRSIL